MLCHHGSTMMSSEALLQTRLARFDVLFLGRELLEQHKIDYIKPRVNTFALAKKQPLIFKLREQLRQVIGHVFVDPLDHGGATGEHDNSAQVGRTPRCRFIRHAFTHSLRKVVPPDSATSKDKFCGCRRQGVCNMQGRAPTFDGRSEAPPAIIDGEP